MKVKFFLTLAALTMIISACTNDLNNQIVSNQRLVNTSLLKAGTLASDFDRTAEYWESSNLFSPYNQSSPLYVYEAGKSTLSVIYHIMDGVPANLIPPSWCYPINNAFDDFHVWKYLGAGLPLGDSYPSFCSDYFSLSLGGDQGRPYVDKTDVRFGGANASVKADVISAFNYINDKWGSLDQWPNKDGSSTVELSTKFIAQIALWVLLHDGIDDAKAYPEANWTTVNAAVADVLANSKGYTGTGATIVTDIVFLADKDFVTMDDLSPLAHSQPQIVALFGNGTPPPRTLGPAYASVTATNAGVEPMILKGLNPKNGNPFFGDKNNPNTPFVVPNSNHFVYAVLDRAALAKGVALDMLVGNKFDVVGKASVKLVGNNLEITIDGVGSFGAIAFNQLPVISNGNIHSAKAADLAKLGALTGFNHDNKAVIPCPAGNLIYLYIHCETMQFYQNTTVIPPPQGL